MSSQTSKEGASMVAHGRMMRIGSTLDNCTSAKNILKFKSEKFIVDIKVIEAQLIPNCSYKKKSVPLRKFVFSI